MMEIHDRRRDDRAHGQRGRGDRDGHGQREEGKLVLGASTWISLIGLISTAVAANLALIYGMSTSLQSRIDALDERWQDRIVTITRDLKSNIQQVESRIPPDWFRAMVDRNSAKIDKLEDTLYKKNNP